MTSLRRFKCDDLFRFNNVNLDVLTETYSMGFYLQYLAKWPEYFQVTESPSGQLMGYIMGKAEGEGNQLPSVKTLHGHVTAVTVAPEYRRLGLARRMMRILEDISIVSHSCYFVDLYVRKSNALAIDMYQRLGYSVFREVIGYYSGEENAYDKSKQ